MKGVLGEGSINLAKGYLGNKRLTSGFRVVLGEETAQEPQEKNGAGSSSWAFSEWLGNSPLELMPAVIGLLLSPEGTISPVSTQPHHSFSVCPFYRI